MRSILLERSEYFFEILRYDKSRWIDFWIEYRTKKFPVVVPLYEKVHRLTDESIEDILNTFDRPFLDKLSRKIKSNSKKLKEKAVKELARREKELELSKEGFHMMIIGLLGLEPYTLIETNSKGVIALLDPIGIEKRHGLSSFINITIEAAFKAKERSDSYRTK